MEIVSTINGDVYLIALTGQMWIKEDLIAFETAVNEGLILELPIIVIDGNNLSFINSQGLGLFANCTKKVKDAGAQIILYCPKEAISDLIELSGISMLMPIVRSKEDLDKKLESLKQK